MPEDAEFLHHRPLVVRLAYDITGSWTDAEDVAQQAYVRWRSVPTSVTNPRAYLARIATNLALDVVTVRQRVGYPGPFLPQPVPTGPGADASIATAAEVEVALMVVLASLSPLERAAFLLHDVFRFTHAEVAEMIQRDPAAVRQLASRARHRIEERRPSWGDPAFGELEAPDAAELRTITHLFLRAAQQGDLDALQRYLTDDVVFVGDGGGKRTATMKPVVGAEKVARMVAGLASQIDISTRFLEIEANRRPALAIWLGDDLDQVLWTVIRKRRIEAIYTVRNPDKLKLVSASLRHPDL